MNHYFIAAMHGWKHPRHATCLEWSCMALMWLILATTEVQFITSGIGLMIYGLHLHASGKSFITLL